MIERIINGDCLTELKNIEDNSVDCCVTSPPYYGLRDYGEDGQIGLEDTPESYIEKLVDVFREVKRVLKDDGTLWLNIGDSYWGSGSRGYDFRGKQSDKSAIQAGSKGTTNLSALPKPVGDMNRYKNKDIIGIPWMLAFALRADGWYLRQDIIWHKPNPMPESVKDRCTKSHEYIFLLSKSPHYYFDYEAIQEESKCKDDRRAGEGRIAYGGKREDGADSHAQQSFVRITEKRNKREVWEVPEYKNLQYNGQQNHSMHERRAEGLADIQYEYRNKRDVWEVPTCAVKDAHFATYPEKLIEPCILAGCRVGGVVLDPFFGSGTTGRVAQRLNRGYIGIELNPEYIEISERRNSNQQMTLIGLI